MTATLRPRLELAVNPAALRPRPVTAVRQYTLRPAGQTPLEALVAQPAAAEGLLVYFPGFNTPLGPWEIARCAYLADLTGLAVVVTEIPGMSRFHHPIPKGIRKDLLAGRIGSWAELNLAYLAEAMAIAGIGRRAAVQVLGFSTGCSLAVAALPVLSGWGALEGLNLVEPVAISQRNLAALQAHNLIDWGRMSRVLATNRGHDWVEHARRRQRREPAVRYSPVDLVAIAQVLAGRGLAEGLDAADVKYCSLVRGSLSSLCRRPDYQRLDEALAERHVPGPTITVHGLGHQLWHSFPAVAQIAPQMFGR